MTPITISAIQQATAEHFGMRLEKMLIHQRFDGFSRPRQIAMHLSVELTDLSSTKIGAQFYRDRTTVTYAYKVIAKLAKSDKSIAKAIDDISRQLLDDPRQINLPLVA